MFQVCKIVLLYICRRVKRPVLMVLLRGCAVRGMWRNNSADAKGVRVQWTRPVKIMIEIFLEKPKSGVYCYRELKTGIIVYIGKDGNLSKKSRHYGHMNSKGKKRQLIDKVLQSKSSLYVYEQLLFCDKFWMDVLEETLIKTHIPKFNILLK